MRREGTAHGTASSNKGDKKKFEPNDFGTMKFQPGRFVCESAALPPKVQNPDSYLWEDRGYLVLDRFSCKGSLFDKKCLCWDDFAYLQGGDPKTSQFMCDDTCTWGQCEGKKCGKKAPPPLPPPTDPPPEDPGAFEKEHADELHNTDNAEGWYMPAEGGAIEVEGAMYNLTGVRIRAGSEHTFRGERRALEVQLEHKLSDPRSSALLFLAFTVTSPHEQGAEPLPAPLPEKADVGAPDFSPAIETLAAAVRGEASDAWALGTLVSAGTDPGYMLYAGSRTAPPCENARWLVKRAPPRASCSPRRPPRRGGTTVACSPSTSAAPSTSSSPWRVRWRRTRAERRGRTTARCSPPGRSRARTASCARSGSRGTCATSQRRSGRKWRTSMGARSAARWLGAMPCPRRRHSPWTSAAGACAGRTRCISPRP